MIQICHIFFIIACTFLKSGTSIFIIVKNKEFICIRKLFINDSSQKIEKRENLCYALKSLYKLYQYFINHKGNGQIIIVDDLNVMPDINLQAAGVPKETE